MAIDPITRVNTVSQLTPPNGTGAQGPVDEALTDFGTVLSNALGTLNQKEAVANSAISSLAAGEDIEIHQVMLAMQEADISFQLALEVRNKVVEAYQEVMRMQV
jgi:flagellar hook-basal body complex protein FliE